MGGHGSRNASDGIHITVRSEEKGCHCAESARPSWDKNEQNKQDVTSNSTIEGCGGTDHALAQLEGGQNKDVRLERLDSNHMRGRNDSEFLKARKEALGMHCARLMLARAEKVKCISAKAHR